MPEGMTWGLICTSASAAFFCIAMGLVWLFTRRIPQEVPQHSGPEIEKRGFSRRTKARLLAAIPIMAVSLTGIFAGVLMDSITVGEPITPDFYSDTWAAECNSSVSRQSVSRKKRRTRSFNCDSFTGAHTLWRIHTKSGGQEIELEYQLEVEKGLADLVLVYPDGTVTRLSGEDSPYTFTAREGETRLRLIGDKGKLEYTVTIQSMDGTWLD